jgi:ABC-type sugar transport system substrate-binding protein
MIQEIQQGIADKAGAIITFPESAGFGPVLAQAKAKGIVTGTMYGGSGAPSGEFNAGANWTQLGAQYVAALAGRKGTQYVALLSQAAVGVGAAYDNGFKAAAAKTHGHVQVVAEGYTNDDPATAQQQAQDLLTAHPNINVFASNMGTATTPVVSVVKSKGLVGKVVMLANGGSGGGIVGAQQHVVYRFLMQNLCALGSESATLAEDIAIGAPHPSFWAVPTVLAGLGNYKKLAKKGWA